jgi:hypothetical protein
VSMLGVLLKAYMRQAAAEKEAGLVLGHSRGLLTWSDRFLEASSKVSTRVADPHHCSADPDPDPAPLQRDGHLCQDQRAL